MPSTSSAPPSPAATPPKSASLQALLIALVALTLLLQLYQIRRTHTHLHQLEDYHASKLDQPPSKSDLVCYLPGDAPPLSPRTTMIRTLEYEHERAATKAPKVEEVDVGSSATSRGVEQPPSSSALGSTEGEGETYPPPVVVAEIQTPGLNVPARWIWRNPLERGNVGSRIVGMWETLKRFLVALRRIPS